MHGNFEGINSFIPRGCAPVCNKYVLILCCFRDIARYSDSTDAETQLSPPYNTGVLEAPIRHTPGRTQNPIIHLLSRTQSHLCKTGNLLSDNCKWRRLIRQCHWRQWANIIFYRLNRPTGVNLAQHSLIANDMTLLSL